MASSLLNLGTIARYQRDYTRATSLYEESLAVFRELDHKRGVAWSLRSLGTVALCTGQPDRAARLLQESLMVFRDLRDKRLIAWSFQDLGAVARHRGEYEVAARLLGAASALREAIGAPLPSADRAAYEDNLAALRANLSDAAFSVAWEQGKAMPLEEAIQYALGGAGSPRTG
jgi:tetratricopeptide (TPR) repeat protein